MSTSHLYKLLGSNFTADFNVGHEKCSSVDLIHKLIFGVNKLSFY